MNDHRLAQVLSRSAAVDDAHLRRLFDHKDRLVALLRANRQGPGHGPVRYRSQYAASLWALAHGDGNDSASAA